MASTAAMAPLTASSPRVAPSRQQLSGRPGMPAVLRCPPAVSRRVRGARRAVVTRAAVMPPESKESLGSMNDPNSMPTLGKSSVNGGKPRIVVLGSGWAAMSYIKAIPKSVAANYDITIVSPRNYFLYTPLLPAVATGTCEERSIVEPVRKICRGKADFFEANCQQVDTKNKRVIACFPKDSGFPEACFQVPYDILVCSVGSTNNTFGCPGVTENCLFFKSIEDAKKLRLRISECFERASLPYTSDEERAKLLSFVVVGGGPTGVEVAAEMHDMITENLTALYPSLMKHCKIRVVELMDHVLGTYDRAISDYTASQFNRSGIELVVNSRVSGVTATDVKVFNTKTEKEELVAYGACVWATGIKMNPLTKQIAEEMPEGSQDHFRCLLTDGYFRVKGSGGSIYCLGDAGTISQEQARHRAAELFKEGDANGDNKLQLKELAAILKKGSSEFPQLAEYAEFLDNQGSMRFGSLVKKVLQGFKAEEKKATACDLIMGDLDMDTELTLEQFEELLAKIDAGLRGLPATAQVAKQQGEYLASMMGKVELTPEADLSGQKAFEYSHKGSLAYIGQDRAVLDAPIVGSLFGLGVGYLWKGYETYGQISWRNRVLVSMDWLRAKIFGRDISRI